VASLATQCDGIQEMRIRCARVLERCRLGTPNRDTHIDCARIGILV